MTEQATPMPDTTPPPSELTDPPVPSEEEGEKYDGGPIPEVAPEVETVPDPEG
jgi:hypothetical protein